jgi:serine/threonine-protein kinase
MSDLLREAKRSEEDDGVLADLVAEITDRLHAGERVDVDEYLDRYPERAERLRRLLPALEVLDGMSASTPAERQEEAGAAVPSTLGDFRIIREVGRGGMGVVYEAEQLSLGRRVALKMLPFAGTLDARQLQRFKNEAQAAACLQHQHIVPVYYVGCDRGVHYYAMQFVDGQPLTAIIRELRQRADEKKATSPTPDKAAAGGAELQVTTPYKMSQSGPRSPAGEKTAQAGLTSESSVRTVAYFRGVAQLGVQAAEALQHAHDMGVIHRDIKPGNLLLDGRGNLWVTDFGLARVQTEASVTLTGDLVGTVRYMSPEQSLAKRVVIDHRTDIYSLGVTRKKFVDRQQPR